MDCRGAIRFATDLLMSPEQCVHIGWDAELVSSLLEFIERLRDIHVDVIEFCFLNAIVLTYPGLVCLPYFAGSLEVGLSIYVHIVYFLCVHYLWVTGRMLLIVVDGCKLIKIG